MSERTKNQLGQYFTPRPVADLMTGMLAVDDKTLPVLEPSSGEGVFLDSLAAAGFSAAEGVEIDEMLAAHDTFPVHAESFVTWASDTKFAAVIGNPPYIRWRDLDARSKEELQAHPLWGTMFSSLTDYLTVFIVKSVQHLADDGELVFITPRFWMHTSASAPLREWLLQQGALTDIVDFDEAEVFPKVSSSLMIFRFVKGAAPADITLRQYVGKRRVPAELSFEGDTLFTTESIPHFQPNHHWTLAASDVQQTLESFEQGCLLADGSVARLGGYLDIANGLVSGLDAAFRIPEDAVLNDAEQAATINVLKARNAERMCSTELLPYIYLPSGLTEADVARDYPTFHGLLKPDEDALLKRHSYTPGLPFWEWAFPRSAAFHFTAHQKAMVPVKERLTSKEFVRFSIAADGAVATQDMVAFMPAEGVRESLEYIVAFLTLPAVTRWVKYRGVVKNNVAEFGVKPLNSIPFRPINWEDAAEVAAHDRIVELVSDCAATELPERLRQAHQVLSSDLMCV